MISFWLLPLVTAVLVIFDMIAAFKAVCHRIYFFKSYLGFLKECLSLAPYSHRIPQRLILEPLYFSLNAPFIANMFIMVEQL